MDVEILEDLGLTNAEIKVYLALLELGASTAGPIIRKAGLQNSVVHAALPKLIEKGFVSFVKKGGIKEYAATDPKNILKFVDEKRMRIERLLPQLLAKQKPVERQEAEVFYGFKGFKAMLYELIKDAKPGDEYLFFGFTIENPEDYKNVYDFYMNEYYKERKKRGIVVKGISPTKFKPQFTGKWSKKAVKFVDFPIPTNISIFNDMIIFTPWEDQKIAFLVRSRQLADSFRKYFYSVWGRVK